jgi:hypothetical protein
MSFSRETALVGLVALFGCTALIGCVPKESPSTTSSPLVFSPGTWKSTDGHTWVLLREDGTGEYVDLPRSEEDPFACALENIQDESGSFVWWYSESMDQVHFVPDDNSRGDSFLPGGPSGEDWRQLTYFPCSSIQPDRVDLLRED